MDRLTTVGPSGRSADAAFSGGDSGPFILEELGAERASASTRDFRIAKRAIASCKRLSFDLGHGEKMVLAATPFAFGGTSSIGRRLDGFVHGVQINGYLDLEEINATVVLFFAYVQVGEGSSQLAYDIDTRAVAKAKRRL